MTMDSTLRRVPRQSAVRAKNRAISCRERLQWKLLPSRSNLTPRMEPPADYFWLFAVCILWFAKTSAETKNGALLGKVSLNTITASIQQEDSGGHEPECAWSVHI